MVTVVLCPVMADLVEKIASLKWLQIRQITNDVFD